ncbi:hypothetical protein Clacol_007270 [Clathrus columnatus]|uniref:t-SNARE coiled-coil homology domain-containing protein n=1 Tax=Clathrus columnatus TaxID=1419009 RepID=A0AAV5AEG1_9AGAM|nr:hypothetical protein Clacol_007270 [Clathrus columnatus]
MSTTLPKLTSLSTQTLTLVFERQRLQTLSKTEPSVILPASSLNQITRNLTQLRSGIYAFEEKDEHLDAAKVLREQYDRMREMLGADKELVEALVERQTKVVESSPQTDPMTIPYKDDPDFTTQPYADMEPDTSFNAANELEGQRFLMEEQDTRLDALHSSISRTHSISQELSSELDLQAGLLDQLDTEVDDTTSRLGRARKSLDKFSRGMSGNGKVKFLNKAHSHSVERCRRRDGMITAVFISGLHLSYYS